MSFYQNSPPCKILIKEETEPELRADSTEGRRVF